MPRLIVLFLAFASMGMTCGSGDAIPEPEYCYQPATVTPSLLEIGAGDSSTFAPLADGDTITIITNPQGGDMIPIKVRAVGAAACTEQDTTIYGPNGIVIGLAGGAVEFHDQGDGSFMTNDIWVQFDAWTPLGGSWAIVQTTVAGVVDAHEVWLGAPYAGPDVAFPAEPTVIAPAEERMVTFPLSRVNEEPFTVFVDVADQGVVVAYDALRGVYIDEASTTITFRGESTGVTDVTLFYGAESVTGTITVQ